MPVRKDLWKLRTDPFFPEVDPQGMAIPVQALDGSLNPLIDERVVPFYFDVYDWTESRLVGDLSPTSAFGRFPALRVLPRRGLTLLLSGARESGRDSLANLVLHKIRQNSGGKAPVVIDVELKVRDLAQNCAAVARRLINRVKYGTPAVPDSAKLAEAMQSEYDRVSKELQSTVPAELFQTYAELLEPVERPMVIKVTGGGSYDNWAGLHDATRSCCPYFIVMTPYQAAAKTCYDVMNANGNSVAWIQAMQLSCKAAKEYVAARLTAERLSASAAAAQPFFPFTPEAIDVLYEPGRAARDSEIPLHSIGWLRRVFYTAFSDHLATVEQRVGPATPEALARLDPLQFVVGRAEVVRAVNKLQVGRNL